MDRSIYLMCRDTPVIEYNVDIGEFYILNKSLVPYGLKDKFRDVPKVSSGMSQAQLNKALLVRDKIRDKNNDVFNSWLSLRLLPIDRENAKRIALALGQDPVPRLKLIYTYRGLSITDNYWLTTSLNTKWEEVNVRKVSLSESIALVALHGTSVTLRGQILTPEVTNQGAYAKAWLNRDGELWLYKKGARDSTESRIEAMVSNLLDKCNVRHVPYEMAEEYDPREQVNVKCCRCPCISDDTNMILPAMDYEGYCNSHGLNFDKECIRIDADLYYKMMIVDFLIANRDRHGMNWGFFASGLDNYIKCMHPLFDHNNAFDKEYMLDQDLGYQALPGKTLRQAAKYAMSKVDFHFTESIVRKDFITDRQYNYFMARAEELGIKIAVNEKLDWCRKNSPEALAKEDDNTVLEMMNSSWLNYLRFEYCKPTV